MFPSSTVRACSVYNKRLARVFTGCHIFCCIAQLVYTLTLTLLTNCISECSIITMLTVEANRVKLTLKALPQFLDTCQCCYYIDKADMFVPRCLQDIRTRLLSRHISGLVHYNHKLKTRTTEEITTSRCRLNSP